MEELNFQDVFAELIRSFESAADKVKKLTDELEDEVYMRIANDRRCQWIPSELSEMQDS